MVSKIQPLDRLSTPATIPWATPVPPPALQPLTQELPPDTHAPFSFSGRYGMHAACMQQTDVMCFAHMMTKPQQCFKPGYASSTCALTKPSHKHAGQSVKPAGLSANYCSLGHRCAASWQVPQLQLQPHARISRRGHTAPRRSASAHACAAIAVRHAAASIEQDTCRRIPAMQACAAAMTAPEAPLAQPSSWQSC